MAALTADRKYMIRATGGQRIDTHPVGATQMIWNGAIVAVNATGFIVRASDATGLVVWGIAQSRVDNTTGADGDKEVAVLTGVRVLVDNAGNAVTRANSFGRKVYIADDHSITTAAVATNDLLCGVLDCIDTDGTWVFIDGAINATS